MDSPISFTLNLKVVRQGLVYKDVDKKLSLGLEPRGATAHELLVVLHVGRRGLIDRVHVETLEDHGPIPEQLLTFMCSNISIETMRS